MNELERQNHEYLGDGVYVEFNGKGLWLRTGHHDEKKCDDKIYLEQKVFSNLNLFVDKLISSGKI